MADMFYVVLVTVSVAQRRHYGRHKRKKRNPPPTLLVIDILAHYFLLLFITRVAWGWGKVSIIIGTPTIAFIVPKARIGWEGKIDSCAKRYWILYRK